MRLGNVASVRSGLVLSRKQAKGKAGIIYPALNLRCINPTGSIDKNQMDVYEASELLPAEYLTHPGDIVVRLTAPYTAVLIDEATAGIVISSSFAIIRADRRVLKPEYLFWLLNTASAKREIFDNATGSMISAIKPKFFSYYEIDLPSVAGQEKIAALNALAKKETQLLYQLAEAKKNYYDTIMDNIHNEMKRG